MEPKRYWWVYSFKKVDNILEQEEVEEVSDKHPFLYCRDNNRQLVTWQSISVEEYNLFNELNNKQ